MKKMLETEIIRNEEISKNIFKLSLKSSFISKNAIPGQFIQVYTGDSKYILARPISIYDIEESIIHLVYQVVGDGTEILSKKQKGDSLKVIGPLGNGYEIKNETNVALVGGGIGIPPLMFLAKTLIKNNSNIKITTYLGYRSKIFLEKDFENLGINVKITTDDGSFGFKGNVVELMRQDNITFDVIYSCGPKAMLKNLSIYAKNTPCFVSLEERMACGFGACVGCTVPIKNNNSEESFEYKKVCKDGPVFDSQEVIWDV